jgi:hypothetical protein
MSNLLIANALNTENTLEKWSVPQEYNMVTNMIPNENDIV